MMKIRIKWLAIFLTLLSLTAFGQQSIKDIKFYGFNPLEADQKKGLDEIWNGKNQSYGIPLKLYNYNSKKEKLSEDDLWKNFGFFPSPSTRIKQQATDPNFSIAESMGIAEEENVRFVRGNCLACHAGVVAGVAVAGLGNHHHGSLSFAKYSEKLVQTTRSTFGKIKLRLLLNQKEFNVLENHVDFLETIFLPSTKTVNTRGDNHGPFLIWRIIARFSDPVHSLDFQGSSKQTHLEALLDRPYPTVDPQPWWNIKNKKRLFWTQDTSINSHASFALNLMDIHQDNTTTFEQRKEMTKRQLDFAKGTKAPKYPFQIHKEKAAVGYEIFHGKKKTESGKTMRCSSCHGTYELDGGLISYPNKKPIKLSIVKTDAAYTTLLTDVFKPLYEHINKSEHFNNLTSSNESEYPAVKGYTAPPLVGIWASAPYLHNGSIPTVTEVLDSGSRPRAWRKSLDAFAYDKEKLGIPYQLDDISNLNDPMVYNTSRYGKTITGHTFGDKMNKAERAAVIEYLKNL